MSNDISLQLICSNKKKCNDSGFKIEMWLYLPLKIWLSANTARIESEVGYCSEINVKGLKLKTKSGSKDHMLRGKRKVDCI